MTPFNNEDHKNQSIKNMGRKEKTLKDGQVSNVSTKVNLETCTHICNKIFDTRLRF